jgi:hypothetical protein
MKLSLPSPSITAVHADDVDGIPYSGRTSTRGWGVFTFSIKSIKQHQMFSAYKRKVSKHFMALFLTSYWYFLTGGLKITDPPWIKKFVVFGTLIYSNKSNKPAFVCQIMYVVATLKITYILRQFDTQNPTSLSLGEILFKIYFISAVTYLPVAEEVSWIKPQ